MDLVSVDNVRLGILAAERFVEAGVETVRLIHRQQEDNLEVLIRMLSCEHALRQRGIQSSRLALETMTKGLQLQEHEGFLVPGHDSDFMHLCELLDLKSLAGKKNLIGVVADHRTVLTAYPEASIIRIDPEAVGRAAATQLLWRLQNLHAPPQTVLVRAVG
jgi:DNA-binding LacI/PurR family transcriptional regulator